MANIGLTQHKNTGLARFDMPVMGPDRSIAKEKADKAFDDIARYMKNCHNIDISKDQEWLANANNFNKHRVELKLALINIFWADACDSF